MIKIYRDQILFNIATHPRGKTKPTLGVTRAHAKYEIENQAVF